MDRPFVVQLPASVRVRRALRIIFHAVGLACLVVAWDLLLGAQGSCVSFCTPAFRAGVLTIVGGGCGLVSLTVGSRRFGMLLLTAAAITLALVGVRITA